MKIEDVMTRDVITVAPQSQLKAVAETLARHRISGVPVVDGGRVLGVVSEADIVEKEAAEARRGRSGGCSVGIERALRMPAPPARR